MFLFLSFNTGEAKKKGAVSTEYTNSINDFINATMKAKAFPVEYVHYPVIFSYGADANFLYEFADSNWKDDDNDWMGVFLDVMKQKKLPIKTCSIEYFFEQYHEENYGLTRLAELEQSISGVIHIVMIAFHNRNDHGNRLELYFGELNKHIKLWGMHYGGG